MSEEADVRLRKALRTIVDTVLFSRGLQHARAGPGLPVTQNWATTDQISGETSLQSEMELGGSSGKLWVLGGEAGQLRRDGGTAHLSTSVSGH